MDEVKLGLTNRLVLRFFHDLLAKVSKLCVNPAVCLDVNKPVEIVSLRHSCNSAILRKHPKSLDECVSGGVSEMRSEVIGGDSFRFLHVFLREDRALLGREGIRMQLDIPLREEFIRGKVGPAGELLADFVADFPSAVFPFLGHCALMLALGTGGGG